MAWKPCRLSYRRELIEAIHTVLPAQWFSQFPAHGSSRWTAQKVFWASVVMGWQSGATLGERFRAARDVLRNVFPRWQLGRSLSGFLEARERLLEVMRRPLMTRLQLLVALYFEQWRVRGWLVFAVDGSRFETSRTTANEQQLGCAGKESTTPQVFQTTLQHVGTGLVWDFRLGPGTDSERRHLDAMRQTLPPQTLLTADAGFISFELCSWLVEHQQAFVLRVGSNARLLTALGWVVQEQASTVYLWPARVRDRPPVVLRLIVIEQPDRRPVYLVTNILDQQVLSDEDAAELYRLRWGVELYYRSIKQTFGHARLCSRTPDMSLAEQTWHVFAAWVLQLLSVRELIAAGKAPANWSAAKARDAARTLLRRALAERSCPPAQTFRRRLQAATLDPPRPGPKQTRHWPRKKQATPPGPPKLQPATPQQRQQAQQLRATINLNS